MLHHACGFANLGHIENRDHISTFSITWNVAKKMELGGRGLMECNFISEKESIDNVHERLKAIFPSCRFLLLHILPK